MKISKKRPNCWQRWVFFFEKKNEHGDLLFLLADWIQH